MATKAFRKAFVFPGKGTTHYFPGHMQKGMRQLQRRLIDVDCIVEVHDARIPLSGRNPLFQDTIMVRPHLMLLNKMDIADLSHRNQVKDVLKKQGIHNVLYTNCKEQSHVTISKKIMPKIIQTIEESERYHRKGIDMYNLLVIGVPNVGKSSFINALRRNHCGKGKAAKVGAVAGITRSVMEKIKVSDRPPVYLFDSPGILHPNVTDMEVGMKLALSGCLQDYMVGEDVIVDYLLYWLNQHQMLQYVSVFDLDEPTDNLHELLGPICKHRHLVQKRRSASGCWEYKPDFNTAAQIVLRAFRQGMLGKVNLDVDLLQDTDSKHGLHNWGLSDNNVKSFTR